MADTFRKRLSNAWNVFRNRDPSPFGPPETGSSYVVRPDRPRLSMGNKRSIVSSIYTRIAMDVAAVRVNHVRLDDENKFKEVLDTSLNRCVTLEANIDQTGSGLMQDIVLSMFDEGVVAVVPVDTRLNPNLTGSYDILTLRTGKIVEWYPNFVRVRLYNDRNGRQEEITIAKENVAIIENPLYSVMNEPNSTISRLIRKLNLLDAVDEAAGSGKLDLIIQLPYVIKSESRREQAEKRRKDIEVQLAGSKYGIAYTDGTEKVTQLNRPAENNLLQTIEYLTRMVYAQLGMTESVFDGTADEQTMLNYYNRSIDPILSAITDEFTRKFITRTGQTQKQAVRYFKDSFKLVTAEKLAEIADKFTRNEILSSNEFRAIIGYKPVSDPAADELRNKNISQPADKPPPSQSPKEDEIGNNIKMEGRIK